MFKFLAKTSTEGQGTLGCRRTFPRHLLHRITTLAVPTLAALFSQTLYTPSLKAESSDRPNIVLILADDLGWSDTTLFGTTKFYKTPHIQRLAERGMTFTQAYSSSPLCSPTRASILTGLSPARIGITSPTCHLPSVQLDAKPGKAAAPNKKAILPSSATRFRTEYYSLGKMFKDNGYATGHFGKWHLGPEPYSPLEHGFDVDIPHFAGPGPAGSYVAPWHYTDFDPATPNEHIEDRMADEAVAFMQKHKDGRFFLNYWMFSVHAPFDAKPNLISKYRSKVDPNDPQRSPTYAAMIESMDDAVGTLLDALDNLGIADETIIIFASDNGGNMYNEVDGTSATSNAPLRGGKATMYEGGVRGPAIVAYPGRIQPASRSDQVIQSSDFYPTLLEMLSIDAQPEQSFDGISIVPALKGGTLDRDAIFTFFPHSPSIPQWLPPAVSVHQNGWKLIRVFHGGENGKHRYKLFNLSDDLGETNNLAAAQPERVAAMDALIEEFLVDTQAVVPLANPKFDPSKYDPSLEGKAKLKGGANGPKKRPKGPPAKRVAGWQPEGGCRMKVDGNSLVMNSTGGDPHASYRLPAPIDSGKLSLQFDMASNSSGNGQVFWHEQGVRPAYNPQRSVRFDVTHNGQSNSYAVPFTAENSILGIRIDPSRGAGKMELSNLRLTNQDGKVIYRWKF